MHIISIINNKLTRIIIKSSLFINNDYSLSTDIDKLKEHIFTNIEGKNKKEDINICCFNALYFSFYRYYHNYFFDINQLIETEFLNFIENKNKIYISPEISIKVRPSFLGHLFWTLSEKTKQLFNKRIDKNQPIIENILVGLKSKLNEIKKKYCMDIDLSSKFVTQIGQMISYAQDNLMNSHFLKKSNIDELKKVYFFHINNLFEKPNENIYNTYNIIKDYETFLTNDIENIHKDIINSFSQKVENIIKEINNLLKRDKIDTKIDNYNKNLNNYFNDKKSNLKEELKIKKDKDIKDEIIRHIDEEKEILKNIILDHINEIDEKNINIFKSTKEVFDGFIKQNNFTLKNNFKTYISKINADLNELNLANHIISSERGFFNKMMVSNYNFLKDKIDIILDRLLRNSNNILNNIKKHTDIYFNELISNINRTSFELKESFIKAENEKINELMILLKKIKEKLFKL